jgi:uncharacterized protein with FMN-binding domain
MSTSPVFLSADGQKILKGFHLTLAAITLGGLLSMFALFLLKASNPSMDQFPLDKSIYFINNSVVYYSVIGNVLTALTYALFTKWGFFKFDWIVAKWALLIVLAVFFMVWFIPTVNGMTSLSDAGLHLGDSAQEYERLVSKGLFRCFVLIGLFVAIFFISTIKPWGKRKEDLISNLKRIRRMLITLTILFVAFGIIGNINLNKLRNMPIENSDLSGLDDGVYEGVFVGGGGIYTVKVMVEAGRMTSIASSNDRESKYEIFSRPVTDRIIENQNANVDGITGATTTSKCIMKAVEDALRQE